MTNKIQGKILTKESAIGIPNVVVVIYDMDQRTEPMKTYKDHTQETQPVDINYYWAKINGDRLGSVITDKNGEFQFSYEDNEFTIEGKEYRPDLILFVLAPEENNDTQTSDNKPKIIHESLAIRANAGKTESYIIKISEKKLIEAGISINNNSIELDGKKNKIEKSIQSAFDLSDTIKSAQNTATKEKLDLAHKSKQLAKQIFPPTMLSSVKPEIRNGLTYLKPGENLKEKHKTIIDNGLTKFTHRDKDEKKKPFVSIINSNVNSPPGLDNLYQYLLDNMHGVSIERVLTQFPKSDSQIAKDYISEIIKPASNA